MTENVYWSSFNIPVILSGFNVFCIILIDFRIIIKYQISWKSFKWEPNSSTWTDGQRDRLTDMTKVIGAFPKIAQSA
jgi:hypothetical protein